MKRIWIWVALAWGQAFLSLHGQGTVDFRNSSPVSQPVVFTTTGLGLDSAWVAQLSWATTANGPFIEVTNPPVAFRDGAGIGYWNPGEDSSRVVGVAPGTVAFLKVKVWNGFLAASYDEAAATGFGFGESAVFSLVTGAAGVPPSLPATMSSFKGFLVGPLSPGQPPTIVTQPASQNYSGVRDYVFKVVADGTMPIQYRWFRGNSIVQDGASNTLVVRNATQADFETYTVRVANPWGTVLSKPAKFGTFALPTILSQPQSAQVNPGGFQDIWVGASGDPTLYYQWFHNSVAISGATNALYRVINFREGDVGDYRVTVSNDWGSVTSDVARLTGTPPTLIIAPTDGILNLGTNQLTIQPSDPSASIQWYSNGIALPQGTSGTLVFGVTFLNGNANFQVQVVNGFGTTISPIVWSFQPPSLKSAPASQNVLLGQPLKLSSAATGSKPITYFLIKDGVTVQTNDTGIFDKSQATLSDAGVYRVISSNELGTARSADLRVSVTDLNPQIQGGTVDFRNRNSGFVDSPVTDASGALLSGTNFVAQLYYAKTAPNFAAVDAAPAPFRTGAGAGYWNTGANAVRYLKGIPPGDVALVKVRVWNIVENASYEQAELTGGARGESDAFVVVTGGGGVPQSLPAPMTGFTSFGLSHTNMALVVPTGFSLFSPPVVGSDNTVAKTIKSAPDGTVLFQFDNTTHHYSINIFDFGGWSNPGERLNPGGGAFILNNSASSVTLTFDGGTAPMVLVQKRVAGFQLLSCPLAKPCRVEELLGFSLKDGDTAYQFVNGKYVINTYEFGGWSGGTPIVGVGESVFVKFVP